MLAETRSVAIRVSTSHRIKLLFAALLLGPAMAYVAWELPAPIIRYGFGIPGVLMCAAIPIIAMQLFTQAPACIVCEAGVDLRHGGFGFRGLVPWAAIASFDLYGLSASGKKGSPVIGVQLKQSSPLLKQLPVLTKLCMVFSARTKTHPIGISVDGATITPEECLILLNKRLEEFRDRA